MSDPFLEPSRSQLAGDPLLIAAERKEDSLRVTPPHRHARGQLLGATQGLLSVQTEEGHWVVPAIHAVWIPPDRVHALRSHQSFEGFSVYVAEAACAELPRESCSMRASGLLREAVSRAASWGDGALDTAQLRIVGVILDEIRTLPREQLGLPLPRDPRLLRIARALADNLADDRSLDGWASWAGVSARTLKRKFVIETGFSFGDWRQRARLMRAVEMLAADVSVTTIALELGYDNLSAFIAMFRRTFGVTPSKYFAKKRRSE